MPDVLAYYADELVRQGRTEPPGVLRDALRLVAGVHQQQPGALATLRLLAEERPELADLLGHAHAVSEGRSEHVGAGHHGGGHGHHHRGGGRGFAWDGPWWWSSGPDYVVLVDDRDDDERELDGEKPTTGAVVRWPAVVGPYSVDVSRGPVADPLGAVVRDPWMGPAGIGSLYLAEDREAMDWRSTAAQEGEPERWWVRCAR